MAHVRHSSILDCSPDKIFAFVSRPQLWGEVTPSFLEIKVASPPLKMREGAEYEYDFTRFGITHRWLTRIEDFQQNKRFTERQILGFFDYWKHTCEVEPHGTKVRLSHFLEYSVPWGLVGKLVDDLWLRKDLQQILEITHKNLSTQLETVTE